MYRVERLAGLCWGWNWGGGGGGEHWQIYIGNVQSRGRIVGGGGGGGGRGEVWGDWTLKSLNYECYFPLLFNNQNPLPLTDRVFH